MHPSCLPKLAHPRIDERIAGPAALPGLQSLRGFDEWKALEARGPGLLRQIGEMIEQVHIEIAPTQFAQKAHAAVAGLSGDLAPNVVNANFAPSQMWA